MSILRASENEGLPLRVVSPAGLYRLKAGTVRGQDRNLNRCQVRQRLQSCGRVGSDGAARVPRRPRILIEGGLYHVYNRFARGERVFADLEEAIAFVDLLRDVKQRDGLTIMAWAVLSNHFHMAVRTSAIPLSRTMKYLQGTYSRTFNRRWRRSGPFMAEQVPGAAGGGPAVFGSGHHLHPSEPGAGGAD